MAACGVNHFDVDLRAGISRWPLPLPHQLGVEFAGEVDAVGPGVEHLAVGDRVWPQHEVECGQCRHCRAGQPNLCVDAKMFSVQYLGGYAEYVVAPARATHKLPDGLSFEAAAAGQVVFTTAWHMLINRGRLRARPDRRRAGRRQRHRPRGRPDRRARRRARHRHRGRRSQARPRARDGRRRDDQLQRGVDHRARPRDDRRRGRRPLHRARRRRPLHGQPEGAAQGRRARHVRRPRRGDAADRHHRALPQRVAA